MILLKPCNMGANSFPRGIKFAGKLLCGDVVLGSWFGEILLTARDVTRKTSQTLQLRQGGAHTPFIPACRKTGFCLL